VNFPSLVVGISDSESQPILVLKTCIQNKNQTYAYKYIDDMLKVLRKVNGMNEVSVGENGEH